MMLLVRGKWKKYGKSGVNNVFEHFIVANW